MKVKKLITGMLLIAIFITQINIIPFTNFVYAQDTENVNNTKFHYQQLNDTAKKIYDGIYEIKFNENLECTYFKSWEMIK